MHAYNIYNVFPRLSNTNPINISIKNEWVSFCSVHESVSYTRNCAPGRSAFCIKHNCALN